MPYQEETIRTILTRLNTQYFLPAIQRQYVWKPEQVVLLFDSIMRGYPISSFLFWELTKENRDKWEVYEFSKVAFSTGTGHKKLTSTDGIQNLTLVIDGQQRLTSLLIGLQGSYKIRPKGAWANYPDRFPEHRLYLDLLKDPTPLDDDHEFTGKPYYGFHLQQTTPVNTSTQYWFRVGRILDCEDENAFYALKGQEAENLPRSLTREAQILFDRNLTRLRDAIWKDAAVSYYIERDQDHDRVLDIFIRANVLGTPLNKSQILMSMLTSRWKRNAKAEIEQFVTHINWRLDRKNNLNQDMVMRACLVLCGLPVRYRVSNFTNQAVTEIEANWDAIKNALERTFRLVNSFRIDRDNLTSLNALIPLALFMFHHPGVTFLGSSSYEVQNAGLMHLWLVMALLNGVFGRSSEQMLTNTRRIINDHKKASDFPYAALNAELQRLNFSIYLDDASVQRFLETRYPGAFLQLSLLYEHQLWGTTSHQQDHIFPKALFSNNSPEFQKLEPDRQKKFSGLVDRIGNLELLAANENNEKRAQPFKDWIQSRDLGFFAQHFIPTDSALWEFNNFDAFVEARESLLKKRLQSLFS